MIKLESVEKVKGTYDNEKIDWDRYNIEICSPFSTKEYSIVVDFLNEELTGDCIKYGGWYDLEKEECVELLEKVLETNCPLRNITTILNKEKMKL